VSEDIATPIQQRLSGSVFVADTWTTSSSELRNFISLQRMLDPYNGTSRA